MFFFGSRGSRVGGICAALILTLLTMPAPARGQTIVNVYDCIDLDLPEIVSPGTGGTIRIELGYHSYSEDVLIGSVDVFVPVTLRLSGAIWGEVLVPVDVEPFVDTYSRSVVKVPFATSMQDGVCRISLDGGPWFEAFFGTNEFRISAEYLPSSGLRTQSGQSFPQHPNARSARSARRILVCSRRLMTAFARGPNLNIPSLEPSSLGQNVGGSDSVEMTLRLAPEAAAVTAMSIPLTLTQNDLAIVGVSSPLGLSGLSFDDSGPLPTILYDGDPIPARDIELVLEVERTGAGASGPGFLAITDGEASVGLSDGSTDSLPETLIPLGAFEPATGPASFDLSGITAQDLVGAPGAVISGSPGSISATGELLATSPPIVCEVRSGGGLVRAPTRLSVASTVEPDGSFQLILPESPNELGPNGVLVLTVFDSFGEGTSTVSIPFGACGGTVADVQTTNTNPGDDGFGEADGVVDGADLSYFVEQWLAGCP